MEEFKIEIFLLLNLIFQSSPLFMTFISLNVFYAFKVF